MKEFPLVSVVIPTYNRKEKLVRLVESILQSNYLKDKMEIIVVDDASTDETCDEIKKFFHDVKILRNEKERLVSGSRNVGIKTSTGDLILFVDDDNIVDRHMIKYLVEFMKNNPDVGICAPLMLYYGTNMIWCAGVKRDMITSRTIYLLNEENFKEIKLPEIIESYDFPNCFLVRSEIMKRYDILFDEIAFPMHYEESDFCYKLKKLGYRAVCYTKAIVWHDVKRNKVTGFETDWRTYYTARNRILFHKKYSEWWQFLIFILVFHWIFTFYYLNQILFDSKKPISKKLVTMGNYLKGVWDGLNYAS